jgi:hypothetical protein
LSCSILTQQWILKKMIGEKIYRLTIVELITENKFLVLCDCGQKKEIYKKYLNSGRIRSCGCYNRELTQKKGLANKKHGHCRRREPRTRAYKTWASMIRRCHTPSASGYFKYGARGITVCDAWRNSFETFLKDMGEPPEGKSIDRIDVKKGYSKENCRWATSKEQAYNKSNNRKFTIDGVTKCLKQWTLETGVLYGTALARLNAGHDIKTAISTNRVKRKTPPERGCEVTSFA